MRPKLANAYARAGGDEKAARILGVSLGSARLAKKRHLDTATIGPRKPQGGHPCWEHLRCGPTSNGQRHGLRGGFQRPWKGDRELRSKVWCKEPMAAR